MSYNQGNQNWQPVNGQPVYNQPVYNQQPVNPIGPQVRNTRLNDPVKHKKATKFCIPSGICLGVAFALLLYSFLNFDAFTLAALVWLASLVFSITAMSIYSRNSAAVILLVFDIVLGIAGAILFYCWVFIYGVINMFT